jgi:uncharacterized protein
LTRHVILDTSALFATLDADDRNHFRARRFFEGNGTVYTVPDTVFSEAMTLIKMHLGGRLAIETGQAIRHSPPFRPLRISGDEAAETWRIFSRFTDKGWSYVDCSILAVARRLGVDEVFSFDHHFDQMASLNLRRVPE